MSSVTLHVNVSLQRTLNDTAMGRHRNQKAHEAEMETYPYASRIHRELRAPPYHLEQWNQVFVLHQWTSLAHTLWSPNQGKKKERLFALDPLKSKDCSLTDQSVCACFRGFCV